MASEATMIRVLDLLTRAPRSQIESLSAGGAGQAKSLRRIVATKNVVAVGISEKISKKRPTGKLAVTFYVEKKIPPKKLRADVMIPPTVPESLSGPAAVPTDVIAIGRLRLEVNAIRNPVQPGNSIGHVDITAGTLGALVRKGQTVHILSNSHVLARSGRARIGDDILYPGDADGGEAPADLVATLSGFKKFVTGGDFVNGADCAIARPLDARRDELVSAIKGLGVPRGATAPVRGMRIVKVGRTTDKTTGTVRASTSASRSTTTTLANRWASWTRCSARGTRSRAIPAPWCWTRPARRPSGCTSRGPMAAVSSARSARCWPRSA